MKGNSKLAKFLAKELKQGMSGADLVAVLKKTLEACGGPDAEALGKVLALQSMMAGSNSQPQNLAKALRLSNAMLKEGVSRSNLSRMLHEIAEDNPTQKRQVIEQMKKPLQDAVSSAKLNISPACVSFMQKYQSFMKSNCASVDNIKDIFENAMAVVGLSKEDVAKAAMVQKALAASGVTPAALAQAVMFQRALTASGLSPEEIVEILSKVTSPKFTDDEISILLSKVLEKKAVSKEEIEAISQLQKSLKSGNLDGFVGADGNLVNLIASGEVDMAVLGKAVLMQKILSASGLSTEDLGKAILLQQGMLDAGASPENIASCMQKALLESNMTLEQLAALIQLGLTQSDTLCPEDIKNTLMFDKILGAAQAAKLIAKKISPDQMKLLEASVNASKEGE